jgi:cellulose synthase/poly-beta-1,6-N-acetylglucosamine synthase-like glycosyltransferase
MRMEQTGSARTESLTRDAPPQILEHERGFAILLACVFFGLWSLPIWGSLLIPATLAYIVVGYNLYWTIQALYSSIVAVLSYRRMQAWLRIDWQSKYLALGEPVQNLVMIPNYNERLEILSATLDNLARSAYPARQLNVVLAMEEREKGALAKAERLRAQFAGQFDRFWITSHPLMPDETACKGANLTYALRHVKKYCDELGWDASRVLVTTIDADTRLHPQFLACLTTQFLDASDRTRKFFQGIVMLVNNIWDVQAPIRVLSAFYTFTWVTGVSHYQRMTVSAYSASLRLLEDTNYWDPRVVQEDGHIFFRSFFAVKGMVDIVPVYMPVGLDAVQAPSLWQALRILYRQALRWAWTVSNLPFIAAQWLRHPEISLGRKIQKCLPYFEGLLLLPSSWFVISVGVWLPPLINPNMPTRVFGMPLSSLAPLILSPALIGVITAFVINLKLRAQFGPPRQAASLAARIWQNMEWFLLPFSAVFYFGVLYLVAYWRLLHGRDMQFEPTPK